MKKLSPQILGIFKNFDNFGKSKILLLSETMRQNYQKIELIYLFQKKSYNNFKFEGILSKNCGFFARKY